jgi:hypothetical protein
MVYRNLDIASQFSYIMRKFEIEPFHWTTAQQLWLSLITSTTSRTYYQLKINSGLFYKPVKLSLMKELEVVWRIMQSTRNLLLLPDDSLINLMQVGS